MEILTPPQVWLWTIKKKKNTSYYEELKKKKNKWTNELHQKKHSQFWCDMSWLLWRIMPKLYIGIFKTWQVCIIKNIALTFGNHENFVSECSCDLHFNLVVSLLIGKSREPGLKGNLKLMTQDTHKEHENNQYKVQRNKSKWAIHWL